MHPIKPYLWHEVLSVLFNLDHFIPTTQNLKCWATHIWGNCWLQSTPVCIWAPKNTWVGAKVGSIELWFEKEVAETIDLPMQIEFMI